MGLATPSITVAVARTHSAEAHTRGRGETLERLKTDSGSTFHTCGGPRKDTSGLKAMPARTAVSTPERFNCSALTQA